MTWSLGGYNDVSLAHHDSPGTGQATDPGLDSWSRRGPGDEFPTFPDWAEPDRPGTYLQPTYSLQATAYLQTPTVHQDSVATGQ